jgi:predicted dehydrogenase
LCDFGDVLAGDQPRYNATDHQEKGDFSMKPLRFAVFGTGFWSRFQIPAWKEVGGVECVAAYNRTRPRAEAVAREFGIPAVYDDPEALFANERLDFVDIITDVDTHPRFVELAARHKVPVICQKPMAPTLARAEAMVRQCAEAKVPFFIHENFRWQTPLREAGRLLHEGAIGEPFRARVDMISGFPVFVNQPFLKDLEQFIITDLGSHTLDVARYLMGEMKSVYCRTRRIHKDIKGEDVATIVMESQTGAHVVVEMAYAGTPLERERFPQTFLFIEGTEGSLEVGPDYWVRLTTKSGTHIRRCPPPRYAWADPAYDVVHASIVPCNANVLRDLRGEGRAETRAEDNLQTVRLVFASYDSAASHQSVALPAI